MKIFTKTKRLIAVVFFKVALWGRSKNSICFQNSKIAKGKSTIVVELCHTSGTILPRYIFFRIRMLYGSGIGKKKNRQSASATNFILFNWCLHCLHWAAMKLFEIAYFPAVAEDNKSMETKYRSNLLLAKQEKRFATKKNMKFAG